MRKFILFMLIVAFTVSVAAMPVSAKESNPIGATFILNPNRTEPHVIKVLSVESLKTYLDEYHAGEVPFGFDISKYDEAFFQKKQLLFTYAQDKGSHSGYTVTTLKDTETKIGIEISGEKRR